MWWLLGAEWREHHPIGRVSESGHCRSHCGEKVIKPATDSSSCSDHWWPVGARTHRGHDVTHDARWPHEAPDPGPGPHTAPCPGALASPGPSPAPRPPPPPLGQSPFSVRTQRWGRQWWRTVASGLYECNVSWRRWRDIMTDHGQASWPVSLEIRHKRCWWYSVSPLLHITKYSSWLEPRFIFLFTINHCALAKYKQYLFSDDWILQWRRWQKDWTEQLWSDARRLWFWHRQLHSLGLTERILQQVSQSKNVQVNEGHDSHILFHFRPPESKKAERQRSKNDSRQGASSKVFNI